MFRLNFSDSAWAEDESCWGLLYIAIHARSHATDKPTHVDLTSYVGVFDVDIYRPVCMKKQVVLYRKDLEDPRNVNQLWLIWKPSKLANKPTYVTRSLIIHLLRTVRHSSSLMYYALDRWPPRLIKTMRRSHVIFCGLDAENTNHTTMSFRWLVEWEEHTNTWVL